MPEYAKMKNADLEALLKERGLPTGGKKADMVERLTKDDKKNAAAAAEATPKASAVNPEDEIDWDDDGEDATAQPAKAALATASEAKETAPTTNTAEPTSTDDEPAPATDNEASKTDDLSVKAPAGEGQEGGEEAKAEENKEPPKDYSIGMAASSIDDEIEKRKARAKKFGLKIEDDEGLRKLERMKKFGETGPPKGLDEALPERRKRGREENDDGGRNKRRGGGGGGGGRFSGRRGRGGRRDNRDGRDERRDDRSKPSNGGNWMSDADRAKAEARKAKFAKSSAA